MARVPKIAPRPSARFLHAPQLREQVLTTLRHRWPAGWTDWNLVRDKLHADLRLPGERPSFAEAVMLPSPPPPAKFDATVVDVPNFHVESVILPLARPSALVQRNDFLPVSLPYWQGRMETARSAIQHTLQNVGRVELKNHLLYDWNGTAWLVRPDIAVTNAHVAKTFADRQGDKWVFRINPDGREVSSRLDYREEYQMPDEEEFEVQEVLYVNERENPDIAFLRVKSDGSRRGVTLAANVVAATEIVAIGYPKYDTSVPDPDVLTAVFNGVYDVKRVSPGLVTAANATFLSHDCSTLGGSSGSVLLDLATGAAAGLHFGGSYRVSNFAIPAQVIVGLMSELGL